MTGFCHLHAHSCYSFLEGLPTPAELARAAADAGMPALALTDHLSLSGAPAFYRACRDQGVQPVLGLEIDLILPYHLTNVSTAAPPLSNTGVLVLLAANYDGWRNLCRLSSDILCREDTPAARAVSLDLLARHAAGNICLTGGCRGAFDQLLAGRDDVQQARVLLHQLKDIFGDRLYVELHRQGQHLPGAQDVALRLAGETEVTTAACHSIYYLQSNQAALQRSIAAIRAIRPVHTLSPEIPAPPDSAFLTASTMQQRFADGKALAASEEIAARCRLELPLGQQHYPKISLASGETPEAALRRKAVEGARRLYGPLTPAVTRRLDSELETIASRGYAPLFLIAQEMIAFARDQGIPSASRGSASSSLVAHCIGITSPDPVALDLYFERFLNPARSTPPDIDTDFCSRRRDEVIRHLFQTYGQDQIAMVGTINTFRPRSALLAAAKAMDFQPAEIRAMAKRLPWFYHPGSSEQPQDPFAELSAEYGSSPRHAELFDTAKSLLGLPHHLSVHPGGVVIAPGAVVDYVPVARTGGKDVVITQFDLDDVEAFGLVKLDLLGIRGLTVLGDVMETLYSWRRTEYRSASEVFEDIPEEDQEVSALLASGRTIGCFQIESPGMRATLRDIQAQTPADLMVALALYRPGPLKGGLRDAFVRRHNRQEAVTHLHHALSQLLAETYGVILYQEQVLRIAHELAGMTLAEADLLRRAMSHFDPGKQMKKLQESFVEGAKKISGIPAATGTRIWEMMAAFAGYGFPKAHAASYAQVAWRSAWCKTHYPAEFLAAVLANHGGYYPQSVYLNEARRCGFSIRPPHINHSLRQFCVEYPNGDPVLYMGLDQVHDLTRRTQERIQRMRPFRSLADFQARVDPRPQEAARLIEIGALEGLGTIPALLRALSGSGKHPGQLILFDTEPHIKEDWSREDKVAAQQRWLGASLEAHPLELKRAQIEEAGAITTVEAAARVGQNVRVAGMRQALHRSVARQGEGMTFLVLEDLEGMIDVVLPPQVYRRARAVLASGQTPFIVEGSMERDSATGEPVLNGMLVEALD